MTEWVVVQSAYPSSNLRNADTWIVQRRRDAWAARDRLIALWEGRSYTFSNTSHTAGSYVGRVGEKVVEWGVSRIFIGVAKA